MEDGEKIRVERYLAERGILSRREAKRALEEGLISLHGKPVKKGEKRFPHEWKNLTLHPKLEKERSRKETYAVYKPRGYTSGKDGKKTIFHAFPKLSHLHTVGRLDKESEGLILLTNDGLVTKAVTGKDHCIEKEYLVTVREDVLPWMIEKMERGMVLEDGPTLPAKAKRISRHQFRITLREGRKHQIRRMANKLHLTVEELKRTRIHNIHLGRMRPRNARRLTREEVEELKKAGLSCGKKKREG